MIAYISTFVHQSAYKSTISLHRIVVRMAFHMYAIALYICRLVVIHIYSPHTLVTDDAVAEALNGV